ncbi:MAG: glycosyltransferase family 2 protein [Elusimicrobiaceae bacterium]|jgi:glycosyltransferase involved in cell wall biosynthesis
MEELNSLSMVMPVYNEGEIIAATVREYYDTVIGKMTDAELIVVNDCSTDNTGAILAELAKELPKLKVITPEKNGGHGKAILLGYEAASKDLVFQTDSDNQFEPDDFRTLWAYKDKCGMILGYRRNRRDPLHRLLLTKIVRASINIVFGTDIRDANCPFRLMNRIQLHSLLKTIPADSLAPNIMLSILFKKRGFCFTEVPVSHRERKTGTVSIVRLKLLRFALKGLGQLLKLRRTI